MLLEVVAFNLPSAIKAAEAGAHRIEICDNYHEGGTTPSAGIVEALRKKIQLPLVAMVRPRGGDFLYDKEDVNSMKRDILDFKEIGCDGIVVGCLNADATIDKNLLQEFLTLAGPMDVHFNRAFDRVKDQLVALETLIDIGCKRVLTSGGHMFAVDGVQKLKELVTAANDRITIIAGGGVNSAAFPFLFETGAKEFHTPARKMEQGGMEWTNSNMKEDLEYPVADVEEIGKMLESLQTRRNDKQ